MARAFFNPLVKNPAALFLARLRRQPSWFLLSVTALVSGAIILRLYPGRDHFLWDNDDFARDEYAVRQMVAEHDWIKLVGPRSEVYSFRHQAYLIHTGPLYYYFLAPWYALSHGDPNGPLLAYLLLHVTAVLPLALLSYELFGQRRAVLITLLLFAVAYEQIEYSRWLLNPVMAIPFLAWVFYFLWRVIRWQKQAFWLGFVLGLAIQSEIFLGYWLPVLALTFLATRQKLKTWAWCLLGGVLGVLPLIVSEFKFGFRMTDSLIFDFLLLPLYREGGSHRVFSRWLEHWGLVARHALFGTDVQAALIAFLVLLALLIYWAWRHPKYRQRVGFLLLITLAPASVFLANAVNEAYTDLGTGLAFILVLTAVLNQAWKYSKAWVILFISLAVFGQWRVLNQYLTTRLPFNGYSFNDAENLLYIQKMEIVAEIYQLVGTRPFTLSVLDTPYGFPALWASVFEQYGRRAGVQLPQWYGWYAHETPGDWVFQTTSVPAATHVVLRPKVSLIDPVTQAIFFQQQNESTTLERLIEKNNYVIELRRSR